MLVLLRDQKVDLPLHVSNGLVFLSDDLLALSKVDALLKRLAHLHFQGLVLKADLLILMLFLSIFTLNLGRSLFLLIQNCVHLPDTLLEKLVLVGEAYGGCIPLILHLYEKVTLNLLRELQEILT